MSKLLDEDHEMEKEEQRSMEAAHRVNSGDKGKGKQQQNQQNPPVQHVFTASTDQGPLPESDLDREIAALTRQTTDDTPPITQTTHTRLQPTPSPVPGQAGDEEIPVDDGVARTNTNSKAPAQGKQSQPRLTTNGLDKETEKQHELQHQHSPFTPGVKEVPVLPVPSTKRAASTEQQQNVIAAANLRVDRLYGVPTWETLYDPANPFNLRFHTHPELERLFRLDCHHRFIDTNRWFIVACAVVLLILGVYDSLEHLPGDKNSFSYHVFIATWAIRLAAVLALLFGWWASHRPSYRRNWQFVTTAVFMFVGMCAVQVCPSIFCVVDSLICWLIVVSDRRVVRQLQHGIRHGGAVAAAQRHLTLHRVCPSPRLLLMVCWCCCDYRLKFILTVATIVPIIVWYVVSPLIFEVTHHLCVCE